MAEPLKRFFDRALVARIAAQVAAVHPAFPRAAFVADAAVGLDRLELMDRARHIAGALGRHLPPSYPDAIAVLLRSLGPEHDGDELQGAGMEPFLHLPHVMFVADRGLDHFELSMEAQHALTRRFTCEFSIRVFLAREPDRTLAVLRRWARDPSAHVRRLVSEGTRPRLPWAPRLRAFQEDPRPVLALLELLVDDPSTMVRRSVANNLNDVSRDHPALAVATARRWLAGGGEARRRLVAHALRSLVKAGDAGALALLGFGARPRVEVDGAAVTPGRVAIGGAVTIAATLRSRARTPQALAVDLAVHFVKARGTARAKVFKGRALELAPGAAAEVRKTIRLHEMTTRRHHAGRHAVDLLVNGVRFPLGAFELVQRADAGATSRTPQAASRRARRSR